MNEKEEIDTLVNSYRTGVWYPKLFIVPRILYPFINLEYMGDMGIEIKIPGYRRILMTLASYYELDGKLSRCLPEVLSRAKIEETQNVQTQ